MDAPTEVEFAPLLLGGICFMLLAAGALVVFLITYQKRLLQQQLDLRNAEAVHQQQRLVAVIEAQEVERERIGRDLHDDIGSSIAMAKMLVDRLADNPTAVESAGLLGLAREVLGTAVEEARTVSHNLYPAMLARVGLGQALEYLADVSRRSGSLAVVLVVDYPQPLALAQELALYRICQELVHNAIKHAHGAKQLTISLQQSATHLTLTVEDDGCGFDPVAVTTAPSASGGVGLRSIGVRVQMLQARLVHHAGVGSGTCISIELDTPPRR